METSFVYVCDQRHLARLVISLESLKRSGGGKTFVVDYGIEPASLRNLERVYGSTIIEATFPQSSSLPRRIGAYREKTMAAARVASVLESKNAHVVLMDSDILVVDPEFLKLGEGLADTEVSMIPSAWDRDFTWSYTPDSLPALRSLSGIENFDLSYAIPNSGVVCAPAGLWKIVGPVWTDIYDRFLALPDWRSFVQSYATPSDQEFLRFAMHKVGMTWSRLHGSYNMQVSPERIAWGTETTLPLRGGHFDEAAETVKGIHFGVDDNGFLQLTDDMLANASARETVIQFVADLRDSAAQSGSFFQAHEGSIS